MIIIGAGPAGIAAAIQLKRSDIEPVVLEKDEIGGLLRNANLVENYPGFPDGISGVELVKLLKRHLENERINVYSESVLELDYRNGLFSVKTDQKKRYSRIVVVATGTEAKRLTEPEIPPDARERVLYEIYPIKDISGERVVIVGAGDAAFDYALSLSKKNEVVILNRRRGTKCLPLLQRRAKERKNIPYIENIQIKKISMSNDELVLNCISGESEVEMNASYLLAAIGRRPSLGFISKNLEKEMKKLQREGVLYLIGDVKNEIYRQTGIAVGDGLRAAMEIAGKLRRL